jgi:TnsA endonuclease N terminal
MAKSHRRKLRTWRELYSAQPWYSPSSVNPEADMILRVWTPGGGDPRARKVVHRGGTHRRFKLPSQKIGRMVHCESRLEFDLCHLLEIDPDCEAFCEQPMEIHYQLAGTEHVHVPDVLVQRKDASCALIECKYADDAKRDEVAARTHLLAKCLPQLGFYYHVLTEDVVQQQPRLQNAQDVHYFGRASIDMHARQELLDRLDASGYLTWGDAVSGQLGPRGRDRLCRLVKDGILWFDIDQPLLPNTQFVRRIGSLVWKT